MTSTQQQQIDQLLSSLLKSPTEKAPDVHHQTTVCEASDEINIVPPITGGSEGGELFLPAFETAAREVAEQRETWRHRAARFHYLNLTLIILALGGLAAAVVAMLDGAIASSVALVLASLIVFTIDQLCSQQERRAFERFVAIDHSLESASALFKLVQIIQDQDEDWLAQRRATLINKKFRAVLSTEEKAELDQLNARLEELDARFYEPILGSLREFYAQLQTQTRHIESENKPEKN